MKKEKKERLRALEDQGNEYIRITERMVIQFPYIFQAKFDNFEMVLSKEPTAGPVRESNPGPLAP